jgi:two-component system NarL family sensor kinase
MEEIRVAIFTGSIFVVGMVLISLVIILFAQKKRRHALILLKDSEINHRKTLAASSLKAHEEERQRIGKELHDDLGQQLASARMYLENSILNLDENKLEKAVSQLDGSIAKCSDISRLLYPVVLNKFGLEKALEQLTHQTDLPIYQEIEEDISKSMSYNIQLHIYRIYQELISNSIKHAKCTSINMSISDKTNEYLLIYSDNGVGFDYENLNYGLGLHNIKTRCDSIRADLKLNTAIGKGFKCTIKISK